jgi:hypothetical protein
VQAQSTRFFFLVFTIGNDIGKNLAQRQRLICSFSLGEGVFLCSFFKEPVALSVIRAPFPVGASCRNPTHSGRFFAMVLPHRINIILIE